MDHSVVDLIIKTWLERLPSADEMQTVSDDILTAEFSVRVIDLHLVLSRFEQLRLLRQRASMLFGSEIARISPPSEVERARAIRAFATNVVDSILCASGTVTRDQLIMSVIARAGLLPLAPVERGAS